MPMVVDKRKALARMLVDEGSVKKYSLYRPPEEGFLNELVRYVVVGEKDEYFVGWDDERQKATSCTCKDFMINVLFGELDACKHMIAVELAEKERKCDVFYITPREYRVIRKYFLHGRLS